MSTETLGEMAVKGWVFQIYRSNFDSGRYGFMAETALNDGDRILLDHWNLTALFREIEHIVPIMALARRLTSGE